MNFHVPDVSAKSRVPVARILETRASFPHNNLSFEVEFEAEELTALSDLVLLLARSGLLCDNVCYRRNGIVFARLCDSKSSNYRLMAAALAQLASLRLVRWTIILSKPKG